MSLMTHQHDRAPSLRTRGHNAALPERIEYALGASVNRHAPGRNIGSSGHVWWGPAAAVQIKRSGRAEPRVRNEVSAGIARWPREISDLRSQISASRQGFTAGLQIV